MLYECWRKIASAYRQETALVECASGRRWSFGELAAQAEKKAAATGSISYPQGITAEFVLTVLRAWRAEQVVLPLEPGQAPVAVRGLPREIVHLKSTSATSGAARLLAFTAAQLKADADNIVATMGLRPDWPNLGVISLAHSYGFSNLVLPLLLHGIPLVLLDSPLPESVRQAGTLFPHLTLAAVPALWRAWHEVGAIPKNVRLAISAGAPLPLGLEQEIFAQRGLKLHNFYGATECGGIGYDSSETPRNEAACVGTPMHNVRVGTAEAGCVEIRSGAVAQTYWPEPDACLNEGCFCSSDLGEIRGGQLFLTGRTGDQINVAGRKVSPEEIERVLGAHPLVRECLVFSAPSGDAARSEIIVAAVAARSESIRSLKEFLLERLPAWQVPREWWFVDSLSANERGKLSRAHWRAKYLTRGKESGPCLNPHSADSRSGAL
jgi:acyl-CoA synthetase (AMP-forming)/AMP-acid ligase II